LIAVREEQMSDASARRFVKEIEGAQRKR